MKITSRGIAVIAAAALLAGCVADAPSAPHLPAPPSSEARTNASANDAASYDSTMRDAFTAFESGSTGVPVSGVSAIRFATYEGSGEVVHPDVVAFTRPWQGHRFWNALTPYPNSATRFENPSLFASGDGDQWTVPGAASNPLASTTQGHLSDPDMLFEPSSNAMWLYYREVVMQRDPRGRERHVADNVWLMTTTDALTWSPPQRVVTDSGAYAVSPTIARPSEHDWRMYQVNAGRDGCSAKSTTVTVRTSSDGMAWSRATPIAMRQPGHVVWHFDVQYVPSLGEYWAMVAAYPAGKTCMSTSLFLLRSTDGVTWESGPAPILAAGDVPQFANAVYRSTFAVQADGSVTVWYSGARLTRRGTRKRPPTFAWSAAVSHTTVDKLTARVRDRSRGATLQVIGTGTNSAALPTIAP